MVFLRGRELVISVAYRCRNRRCRDARRGRIHTSRAAERLTVRGSSFALEVIVQIGYWRFWKRWTVAQIHEVLSQERCVPIAEREVLYLIGVFLVLSRCTYHLRWIEHATEFRRQGLFLAINALKPEKGNRALYVVRELKHGLVVHHVSLLNTDQRVLENRLLQPLKGLDYRIRGLVSDDEKALRLAIAHVLPAVPHQTCQVHCLRDAALPIVNADRTFKTALKKAIRAPFYAAARVLEALAADDPCATVLQSYADLIRSTLTEDSKPPFALGGLRVFEDLARLDASLRRSREKGGIRCSRSYSRWCSVANRSARYRQLKCQRSWLLELERRLDPPEGEGQPRPTRRHIQQRITEFLAQLAQHAQDHPADAAVVAHITQTFEQRWPRLFACYAWPERYRTNNELETFFGRLRTRQRQIHGRKAVHEFVTRYGEWAIYLDPTESCEQLLQRLQQFDQDTFDREYDRFLHTQKRLQLLYRFRHWPRRCLKALEQQWAEAIHRKPQRG